MQYLQFCAWVYPAVFESTSRRMNDTGFDRTASLCSEKIKKLKAEYKKNNRKTCQFHERLDSVLGSKPATRPPTGIDSFESCSANNSSDSLKSDDNLENGIESTSNNEQSSDLNTEKLPSDFVW